MATRTAPDVSVAAPNRVTSTLHLIDASGDQITEAITTLAAPTLANVEAWAASYQGATQASLWAVSQFTQWAGIADADNADVGQRNSVKDGVNMSFVNPSVVEAVAQRLVAPIPGVMQGNQDIPLVTSTEMTALVADILAILTGYNLSHIQYTERQERANNPRIKV